MTDQELLQAYKDTGLEPEEIDKFKKDIKKIKDDVDSLFEKQAFLNFLESKGIDTSIGVNWMCDVFDMLHDEKNNEIIGIDRLRELVQADRLIGSNVYEPNKRGFISVYEIISVHISKCSILVGWNLIDGVYSNLNGFEISALGKCVFLTRADAEAALRREQDE